jgi:hypothetical protein
LLLQQRKGPDLGRKMMNRNDPWVEMLTSLRWKVATWKVK